MFTPKYHPVSTAGNENAVVWSPLMGSLADGFRSILVRRAEAILCGTVMKCFRRLTTLLVCFGFLVCGLNAARAQTVGGINLASDEAQEKYLEKIKNGRVSIKEAMRWMQGFLKTEKTLDESAWKFFSKVFVATCIRVKAADVKSLTPLVGSPRTEGFEDRFDHWVILQFCVNVGEMKAKKWRWTMPLSQEMVPSHLDRLPAELKEAWRAWRSVSEPYQRLLAEAEKANADAKPPSWKLLNPTLHRLVVQPTPGIWRELLRHCSEKAGEVRLPYGDRPCHRGALYSLLADGKYAEMLGAVFVQCRDVRPQSENSLLERPLRELLKGCGLDWEMVLLGAMLPLEGEDLAFRGGKFQDREIDPWRILAKDGSERSMRLALSILREYDLDGDLAMEFIKNVAGDILPGLPSPRRKLSLKTHQEAMALVTYYLGKTENPHALRILLNGIESRWGGDLKLPLEKLMQHPSHPIASQARSILVDRGLVATDATITAPPPPLRFRLLSNGESLARTYLVVRSGDISSQHETDDEGRFTVPLDRILEPQKVLDVTVVANRGMEKRSFGKIWFGPWLEENVGVQVGEDREYPIETKTAALEIEFDPGSGVDLSKWTRVRLDRDKPDPTQLLLEIGNFVELRVPLKEALTFRGLQIGSYWITVLREDIVPQTFGPITLGTKGSLRLFRLTPGCSVKGYFTRKGDQYPLDWADLYRDGQKVETRHSVNRFPGRDFGRNDGWLALPFGRHHLHSRSTEEEIALLRKHGIPISESDIEDWTAGYDCCFELTPASPPVVDLGEMRLIEVQPPPQK